MFFHYGFGMSYSEIEEYIVSRAKIFWICRRVGKVDTDQNTEPLRPIRKDEEQS